MLALESLRGKRQVKVNYFVYQGSSMGEPGKSEKDLKRRNALATHWCLRNTLRDWRILHKDTDIQRACHLSEHVRCRNMVSDTYRGKEVL